jgi:ubiquinone/menaquinone biosynthesis C-methylase UbiE
VLLSNPSTVIRKHFSKAGFYKLAEKMKITVPGNDPNRFPKFVKYGDSMGSVGIDSKSVCSNAQQVRDKVEYLKSLAPSAEVIVQDYIIGVDCYAIVIEMGTRAVAIAPVEYVHLPGTPLNEKFITFEKKHHAKKFGMDTKLMADGPRKDSVQRAAEAAFEVAGMLNGGCWGRVDLRLEDGSGRPVVLEVNPIPTLFYPVGMYSSDRCVAVTYPGGHAALFDMLLASKRIQQKLSYDSHRAMKDMYDAFAPSYDKSQKEPMYDMIREQVSSFDWTGTVLDLGCGTGFLGEALHQSGFRAELTGVDLSPGMVGCERTRVHYKYGVQICPLEEYIMTSGAFDHVACFGGLQFFDEIMFTAILSRMFMVARKSISFEVDELSDKYITSLSEHMNGRVVSSNNMDAFERFGTPKGWRRVLFKKWDLYFSPHFSETVNGRSIRFERC